MQCCFLLFSRCKVSEHFHLLMLLMVIILVFLIHSVSNLCQNIVFLKHFAIVDTKLQICAHFFVLLHHKNQGQQITRLFRKYMTNFKIISSLKLLIFFAGCLLVFAPAVTVAQSPQLFTTQLGLTTSNIRNINVDDRGIVWCRASK